MVTTKLNLSMTEPSVRQIYAKQGDTGRVLDIALDQTPEDGTLRILRPDGVEVTSEAVTGGEVESGSSFESLTEADVTELTVGIEPVQDLNGYDKPWVGGAGKNLLPYPYYENTKTVNGITFTVKADGTVVANGTATSNAIFLFQGGDWTISENYILSGCPSGGSGTTYSLQVQNTGNVTLYDYGSGVTLPSGTYHSILFIVRSGYTANNLTAKPMLRKASVTDTTWEPYSNICPITGHDEVRVTRTGKNVIGEIVNGGYDANGETDNNQKRLRTNRIKCLGESYATVSWTIGEISTLAIRCIWDENGNLLNRTIPTATTTDGRRYYVTDLSSFPNASYIAFAWFTDGNYFAQDYATNMMVEFTNSPTAYEPYQGSTYTTSLGQTVYGGTLDMVTGVLTVTHAIVDLSSLSWVYDGSVPRFYSYGIQNTVKAPSLNSEIADIICTQYISTSLDGDVSLYGGLNGSVAVSTGKVISVRDEAYTSASTFKDAMEGVMLCYALATPVEYQLTAQHIKTLVGTNNVWASSGDIVSIKFTYGGLLSELPSDATEIVGKCYCDVEQNGVSSMPFTLNVKKNERQ